MAEYGTPSFGQRLLRILGWSFPIGRWFGVDLRVYGIIVVVPLLAAREFARSGAFTTLEVLELTAVVTLGLYFVVWTHEMGHVLAARRYGIRTERITLSPLGGAAHLQSAGPSPKADIFISLAGPAVHLVWLALLWPLRKFVGPHLAEGQGFSSLLGWFTLGNLWTVNLSLALFNLIPAYPLDGGRVFRSLLALRIHPNRATLWAARVGYVGAVAFAVWGLVIGSVWGGILVALAIGNFFACRQAVLEARWGEVYGESRDPWEADPEAWKSGGSSPKAEAASPASEAASARDDAELDRLLDRVSEVGMSGLSRREREALERLSRARRTGGRAGGG